MENSNISRRKHRRNFGFGGEFSAATPKAYSMNKNKLDFIKIKLFKIKLSVRIKFFKIKNFCPEKDTLKRMKRQVIPWEKIIV